MARLDTGWHANPKVLCTGAAGMALHAWSISYCDDARSDGFIPARAWPAFLSGAVKIVVAAGLWEPVDSGYQLHDYQDYNRLRAQIEAEQEGAKVRQSRHRSRVTNGVTNAVSDGVTLARVGAPGPGPGVTLTRDSRDPPKPPLADADAQGAPPHASARSRAESPPPKWEEIAPGQFRGTPNGEGQVDLLTARCPRCERSMPVAEVEDHDCQLVAGEPVQAPPRRHGGRGLQRLFGAGVPPEVEAELAHMASHRPTPEQIAAEAARLGRDRQ